MLQVPYFCVKPFPFSNVGLEPDPLMMMVMIMVMMMIMMVMMVKPFPLRKVSLELDPLLLGLSGLGLHHVPGGSRLLQLLSEKFVVT